LIADPSHICGGRELLSSVARQALDLGYEGLMIESHIAPDKALTDHGQQVTPEELGKLLEKLDLSSITKGTPSLEALRSEIDRLDDELIGVLARRMAVAENIGILKKELKMDVLDTERWENVLKDRLMKADLAGLDQDFLKSILEEIHTHSRQKQK
jgi:chorismate mutase